MATSRHEERGKYGWILLGAVALVTLACLTRPFPSLHADATWGVLAAEQFHVGQSPHLHAISEPDPKNLNEESTYRITWWPPAYQAVPYAFRVIGLNWGESVRLTFLLFWLLGAWGWALYFRRNLEAWVLPWALSLLLLFRFTHRDMHAYMGGEFLFMNVFPFLLLGNLVCLERLIQGRKTIFAAPLALGALSGLALVIKFSSVISLAGFFCVWGWQALRSKIGLRWWGLWTLGAAAGLFVLYSFSILSLHGSAALPRVEPSLASLVKPVFWAAGAWAFALSDLDGVILAFYWGTGFSLPSWGRFGDGATVYFYPVIFLMLGIAAYEYRRGGAMKKQAYLDRDVAFIHLAGVLAALAAILALGSEAAMNERYIRFASVAIIPFLLQAFLSLAKSTPLKTRIIGIASLMVFFVVPALYGLTDMVTKAVIRHNRKAEYVDSTGLNQPWLGGVNMNEFVREVRSLRPLPRTILYLPAPHIGVPFAADRTIIWYAPFRPDGVPFIHKYYGRPKEGVVVVVKSPDKAQEKSIEDRFVDISRWEKRHLQSAPSWVALIGR